MAEIISWERHATAACVREDVTQIDTQRTDDEDRNTKK